MPGGILDVSASGFKAINDSSQLLLSTQGSYHIGDACLKVELLHESLGTLVTLSAIDSMSLLTWHTHIHSP